MANPDLAFGALMKGEPLAVTRRQKRADDDKALQDAYDEVTKRDGCLCRVTGRHTFPGDPDARVRREHHHIVPRSRSRDWRADATNIILVCAEAHRLITAGWIDVEGTDASKEL